MTTPQITVRLEVPLPPELTEVLTLLDRLGQPATARIDDGRVVIETGTPAEAPAEPPKPARTPAPIQQHHRCPDCDQSFTSPQGLGAHRHRRHGYRAGAAAAPKPERAPTKRRFPSEKAAELAAAGAPTHPTPPPPVPPPRPVGLDACAVCGERFASRADLARHRLDAGHHTEEDAA